MDQWEKVLEKSSRSLGLTFSTWLLSGVDTYILSDNSKNKQTFKIVRNCAHIRNQHVKCIKMNPNKSIFGPVVLEITCDIFIIKTSFYWILYSMTRMNVNATPTEVYHRQKNKNKKQTKTQIVHVLMFFFNKPNWGLPISIIKCCNFSSRYLINDSNKWLISCTPISLWVFKHFIM